MTLLRIVVAMASAVLLMILHELPRSLVYCISKKNFRGNREIWKLWHYIDPIGLLFCITNYSGFSKAYMFRIQDRKTNIRLGITGFATLLVLFIAGIVTLRFGYGGLKELADMGTVSIFYYIGCLFLQSFCLQCFAMLLVNLFPISTFDMGMLVAGAKPDKYMQMIQSDSQYKIVLLLLIIFDILKYISTWVVQFLLV